MWKTMHRVRSVLHPEAQHLGTSLTFFHAIFVSLAVLLFLVLYSLGALVVVVLQRRALFGLQAVYGSRRQRVCPSV